MREYTLNMLSHADQVKGQGVLSAYEEELALEGALTKSRLSPCVAVRSEGMVTVVTEKEGLSEGESALLLTLCETHCGVAPSGVKVLCAEKSDT